MDTFKSKTILDILQYSCTVCNFKIFFFFSTAELLIKWQGSQLQYQLYFAEDGTKHECKKLKSESDVHEVVKMDDGITQD